MGHSKPPTIVLYVEKVGNIKEIFYLPNDAICGNILGLVELPRRSKKAHNLEVKISAA